ncbi:enoyl-CoA hydratase/isomerase family protein [Chelatococcus asaccharovorans]|uniref:E-phenylitaconyl-CoA hydratase n=1 Tax=Chelatococcus asaccharovorans TaxID=28210 RepID=A0A2V3TR54_9HYPH|nr:enoyl-CoA hydratase/isomerase family protein [Chelatococcus asaccharovorans]MBS7707840.1 enoyl-CoA hydratase/isomerase family protein [Chelatococcus asaccharovorans]PXW50913.1 E-phenylitaconyl-CoA hydratase [Chelatococcus asaccharovorans]
MTIRTEIQDDVAWVIIDRPEKRNAIDVQAHEQLSELWPRLEDRRDVRVIVLTGTGDQAFCSGADIGTFLPFLSSRIADGEDPGHFCGLTHRRLRKPVIAAINGAALGGGLELALAADLRIAASTATFALPEVKIGAIAGAGGISRLARMIPSAVAARMILTGDAIDAARALEIGLVSDVVPPAELQVFVQNVAASIARCPEEAVTLSLGVFRNAGELTLEALLVEERKAFRAIAGTEAFASAHAKFCARRASPMSTEDRARA